jgi:hypothetical protein
VKLICALCLFITACSPFGVNQLSYTINDDLLDVAWQKASIYKGIKEASGRDYWKSPFEFISDGGGDCEDFSIYLVYLLGDKAEMVAISLDGDLHAIVRYDGLLIEPQIYGKYYDSKTTKIFEIWHYDYLMFYATLGGTKTIGKVE